jgi:hypothetical protein
MRSVSTLPLLVLAVAHAGVVHAADGVAGGVPVSSATSSLVERVVAPNDAVSGTALGAGTNGAPRFTRSDAPDAQPSAPGLRNDSSEVSYRWWASSGHADMGLGLGAVTLTSRPTGLVPGLVNGGGANVVASSTVLTLGMRYRTSPQSSVYADASSWRGNGVDVNDGVAGKVGLEFKSAQSRFNVAYGGLGMRLTGDSKMTVRLRRGGLGLFMRSEF